MVGSSDGADDDKALGTVEVIEAGFVLEMEDGCVLGIDDMQETHVALQV